MTDVELGETSLTVRLDEEMIENLKRENERLQNEKRLIVEQREEHTELVNAVKEEWSLAKRNVNAGVLTRAMW